MAKPNQKLELVTTVPKSLFNPHRFKPIAEMVFFASCDSEKIIEVYKKVKDETEKASGA